MDEKMRSLSLDDLLLISSQRCDLTQQKSKKIKIERELSFCRMLIRIDQRERLQEDVWILPDSGKVLALTQQK